MKNGSRANALLMELLIVILFFMFAAMTLVQIFGMSQSRSRQAMAANDAMLEAQNMAETLYDAEDTESVLTEMGFTRNGEAWTLENGEYTLVVTEMLEETKAGVLRSTRVDAVYGEKTVISLPATRYLEKEAAP
ncbi:MAG: hypothetical protein IJJ42_12005 [Clostridia bacterium]|nr:hypothetical protein [Clostridia bacterium]